MRDGRRREIVPRSSSESVRSDNTWPDWIHCGCAEVIKLTGIVSDDLARSPNVKKKKRPT